MSTKQNKQLVTQMVLIAVFGALTAMLSFTPFGYLKTAGLEISFMMVPVTIGAILTGPVGGALLGGIFGLSSFIQCFGISVFGATLMSISPAATFVVCVIPRIMTGCLTAVIFRIVFNGAKKYPIISYFAGGLAGVILNTVLFMLALVIFFYNTEFIKEISASLGANNVFTFTALFVGINGAIEAIVAVVLTVPIAKAVHSYIIKRI